VEILCICVIKYQNFFCFQRNWKKIYWWCKNIWCRCWSNSVTVTLLKKTLLYSTLLYSTLLYSPLTLSSIFVWYDMHDRCGFPVLFTLFSIPSFLSLLFSPLPSPLCFYSCNYSYSAMTWHAQLVSLTRSLTWMSLPMSKRCLTMSACPFSIAQWSAVRPSWYRITRGKSEDND
jgi:hypothetical protein